MAGYKKTLRLLKWHNRWVEFKCIVKEFFYILLFIWLIDSIFDDIFRDSKD